MYWVVSGDNEYEVLDGQQRTISICEYVAGSYSINYQYFHNLEEEEKEQILNYNLMIYFCEGDDREKLDWFQTINIAGEKLTDQELRNAIYTGPWLTDAKRYFSRTGCPANDIGRDYLRGSSIRQDYLETAIEWINNGNVTEYMAAHQHDKNANELWLYFQAVINWIILTFPNYRREMKGVNWGSLYNQFKETQLDIDALETLIVQLMQDEDVTKKSGVYPFVLTKEERLLNIRAFSDRQKREGYERQKGICPNCNKHFDIESMEADHIRPWSRGGKTISENCQMLCKKCNGAKGGK
jgi:hypothetical protein